MDEADKFVAYAQDAACISLRNIPGSLPVECFAGTRDTQFTARARPLRTWLQINEQWLVV